MNDIRKKTIALWALRLGLAGVYAYTSYSLIRYPGDWIGYLPVWLQQMLPVTPEIYLRFQGAVEAMLAAALVAGIGMRWVAAIAALEMTGIILGYGIDGASFRDIGLLGAAVALFFLASIENKNPR